MFTNPLEKLGMLHPVFFPARVIWRPCSVTLIMRALSVNGWWVSFVQSSIDTARA
jgi:hypothetical protein